MKCPICKKKLKDEDDKAKHLLEKHDHVHGPDLLLSEMTEGKELLTESGGTST